MVIHLSPFSKLINAHFEVSKHWAPISSPKLSNHFNVMGSQWHFAIALGHWFREQTKSSKVWAGVCLKVQFATFWWLWTSAGKTLLAHISMVPAMPPEHFFTFSKPGRKIRPKRNSSFKTSNIANSYTRNNNRSLEIKPCRTSQQRNSFTRTAVQWNHLNLKTLPAFKAKIKKTPITTNQ